MLSTFSAKRNVCKVPLVIVRVATCQPIDFRIQNATLNGAHDMFSFQRWGIAVVELLQVTAVDLPGRAERGANGSTRHRRRRGRQVRGAEGTEKGRSGFLAGECDLCRRRP